MKSRFLFQFHFAPIVVSSPDGVRGLFVSGIDFTCGVYFPASDDGSDKGFSCISYIFQKGHGTHDNATKTTFYAHDEDTAKRELMTRAFALLMKHRISDIPTTTHAIN